MNRPKIYPRRLFIIVFPQNRVVVHFGNKKYSLAPQHSEKIQADRKRRETHSLIDKNSVLELLALKNFILLAHR